MQIKKPPAGVHIPGTRKGEELVKKEGREAGRGRGKFWRNARDATGLHPEERAPIDPRMPEMPPA